MTDTPERRKPRTRRLSPQEQSKLSKRDRRILKWIARDGFSDLVQPCTEVLERRKKMIEYQEHEEIRAKELAQETAHERAEEAYNEVYARVYGETLADLLADLDPVES
jgi:hypothetical protein